MTIMLLKLDDLFFNLPDFASVTGAGLEPKQKKKTNEKMQ